jgi:uncharacterized protein
MVTANPGPDLSCLTMSISDELERLHDLHNKGALTDDEYTVAKAAVLSGSGYGHAAPSERDIEQWSVLLHLSQLLVFVVPPVGLIVPFVIWQVKKSSIPELDEHGRIVANWIVSALIYFAVSVVLSLVLIGIPFLLAVIVLAIVYPIMGAMKASRGEVWRYPLSMTFFD